MMKLFIFWKNLFLYDENSRLTCVSTRKFHLNFFLTNFSLWFQVKISNIWVSEIFCDLLKQTRGAAFAEKKSEKCGIIIVMSRVTLRKILIRNLRMHISGGKRSRLTTSDIQYYILFVHTVKDFHFKPHNTEHFWTSFKMNVFELQ